MYASHGGGGYPGQRRRMGKGAATVPDSHCGARGAVPIISGRDEKMGMLALPILPPEVQW
jgi:hypothetical protein